jgi:hypothetical protein
MPTHVEDVQLNSVVHIGNLDRRDHNLDPKGHVIRRLEGLSMERMHEGRFSRGLLSCKMSGHHFKSDNF